MDGRFPGLPAKPRTAFFGSPDEAALVLTRLIEADLAPGVVVTNADKRRSRRGEPVPTPVSATAAAHGIEVIHDPGELVGSGFDLGVVVAYGHILRGSTLDLFPMVNIHFSLLPRWRGAAPVERAVLAGDEFTGVALMAVEAGLDEGDVFAEARIPIRSDQSVKELRRHLARLGAELLCDALMVGGGAFSTPTPQVGEVTYAKKITAQDLHLDFRSSAEVEVRKTRVGGAWCLVEGKRLKIHSASAVRAGLEGGSPGLLAGEAVLCAQDALRLEVVQPEGGKPMPFADWLRGHRRGDAPITFG